MNLATRWRRLMTFTIDLLICMLISGFLLISIGLTLLSFNVELLEGDLDILLDITLYGTFFFYYFIFETTTQRTIGKYLTKTVVVNQNGTKPKIRTILKRTIFRTIPIEYLSFLHSKEGHHDFLSETKVIMKK